MKVLECITDTNVGGAGILLLTRLKCSDRSKIHTTVVLPQESQLTARFEALNVPIVTIRGCENRSLSLSAIPRYMKIFYRERPDLVHCHGALSARIAAMLCGVPIRLYTRHCVYPLPRWQKGLIGRWFIGHAQCLLSHCVIAVAHAAKRNLLEMGVPDGRIRVIINGVEGLRSVSEQEKEELRKKLEIPQDSVVVGICARLEECKDHMTLLRAAEILVKKNQRYRFLIVGEGSCMEKLQDFCCTHGIAPYVIFAGFQHDVAPYYHLMKVNVNCSVGTETSSLALSEGMSIGVPAIVSDYGGNPYMVRHEENGLLFSQRQYQGLADAIDRLTMDEALWVRLSKGARARFLGELNAVEMTKRTEKLYWELFRPSKKNRVRCQEERGQFQSK